MFTHRNNHGFRIHLTGEARHCYLEPREAMDAPRQILENTTLQHIVTLYDNIFMRAEYRELMRPADRIYFKSLLLAGVIRGPGTVQANFSNTNRNAFDPVDAARLLTAPGATDESIGRRLIECLTLRQLEKLTQRSNINTLPVAERAQIIGAQYREAHIRAKDVWDRDGNLHDRRFQLNDDPFGILIRTPIELYKNSRTKLDRILNNSNIRLPSDIGSGADSGNQLTRREYLGLLALVYRGNEDVVAKQIAAGGLNAIRGTPAVPGLLTNFGADAGPAQTVYDRLVIDELGSRELLRTMGIDIGMNVRAAYLQGRRGRPAGQRAAGTPGDGTMGELVVQTGIPEEVALQTIPGAETWRDNPAAALAFLSEHLPTDRPDNARFLEALRQYVNSNGAGATFNGMSADTVRRTLDLIVDELVLSERVMQRSASERQQLRNKMGLVGDMNDVLKEMGKMVTEYQKNPWAAGAVVLAGVIAVPMVWDFIKKFRERSPFVKVLSAAGLVGAITGFYQLRKTGSAWWDGAYEDLRGWMRREDGLSPEQQTLARLWSREIKLDNETTRKCFAILHHTDVSRVCDFYEDMRIWKQNGEQPGARPQFSDYFSDYQGQFGNMPPKEIGELMFTVLGKFFENRGETLPTEFRYVGRTNDAAERGFQYVRNRYALRRLFSLVVQGPITFQGMDPIDGSIITQWYSDANQKYLMQIQRQDYQLYQNLLAVRQGYVEEQRHSESTLPRWDFGTVMYFESDPAILAQMGRSGRQGADWRDHAVRLWNDTLHNYSWFEPPLEDRSDAGVNLLPPGGTEAELNALTGGDKFPGLNISPDRKAIIDRMQANWIDFLSRPPFQTQVTDASRKALTGYMNAFLNRTPIVPLTQLLNEYEDKKYQLLIALAVDPTRLNSGIIANMNTPSQWTSWFYDWLRWFSPTVGSEFPEINSVSDIAGMLDVNVRTPGGVPDWAIFATIFPRWQASEFGPLRKRLRELEEEFKQYESAPELFGTGATIDTVRASNRLAARRITTQLMMTFLMRLRSNGQHIVDTYTNRMVGENEVASLLNYINDVKNVVVPANTINSMQRFTKLAEEMEAYWPEGRLRVLIVAGRVRVVMGVGSAILPSRVITLAQYTALGNNVAYETALPSATINEFLTNPLSPEMRVKLWIEGAFAIQQNRVRGNLRGTDAMPSFNMQLSTDRTSVEYSSDVIVPVPPSMPTAVSPVHVILQAPPRQVIEKYAQWRDNTVPYIPGTTNPQPTFRGDPFQ